MTERYATAAHAMQSGVAMEHALGSTDGEPKHLRVGVNMALVEAGALAKLLINKGVFSEEEYAEAVAAGLEAEVARYEAALSARLGTPITLA